MSVVTAKHRVLGHTGNRRGLILKEECTWAGERGHSVLHGKDLNGGIIQEEDRKEAQEGHRSQVTCWAEPIPPFPLLGVWENTGLSC